LRDVEERTTLHRNTMKIGVSVGGVANLMQSGANWTNLTSSYHDHWIIYYPVYPPPHLSGYLFA
jgi:hypothetical protein